MRLHSVALRNLGLNVFLLFASFIFSFLVVEFTLRIWYPKYEYAAKSSYDRNASRIWSRRSNSHHRYRHPDSHLYHSVYHNNLALRQHRNFDESDIKSAINVAFFGDSFTENLLLPVQYSLTEPLDYLLNLHAKFNVLNFGVGGYGTDQSFLYYRDFQYSTYLDYVFYIFCSNDLRNIYENNIFSLDRAGKLILNGASTSTWWVRFLSQFHTTYLLIDSKRRLFSEQEDINSRAVEDFFVAWNRARRLHSPRADSIQESFIRGQTNEHLRKSISIFQSLIYLWQQAVEKNGGKFYVVLLPRYEEHLAKSLISAEINVIDLFEILENTIGQSNPLDWRFKNDGHWNEAGNQLAAVQLYRFLEKEINLSPLSADKLSEELYAYYAAFGDRWMPEFWVKKVPISPQKSGRITAKYSALEK